MAPSGPASETDAESRVLLPRWGIVVALWMLVATPAMLACRGLSRPSPESVGFGRMRAAVSLNELRALTSVRPLPIIIDTDIGDDFDDSWALALALASPEDWDVRMVLTSNTDTRVRAQIVAKYLTLLQRTDVPIGIGVSSDGEVIKLAGWAADLDMGLYDGKVHTDGVKAVADLLETSESPLFIVALAPQQNLASLAEVYPQVVPKVGGIFSMMGAVDVCYDKVPANIDCAEFNVVQHPESAQSAAAATWPMMITPLDTCEVVLDNQPWKRLQEAEDASHPTVGMLLESLRFWGGDAYNNGCLQSDRIYDVVALYMSIFPDVLEWEEIKLKVGDDGSTFRDDEGKDMQVAMRWAPGGLESLQDGMVNRLLRMSDSLFELRE